MLSSGQVSSAQEQLAAEIHRDTRALLSDLLARWDTETLFGAVEPEAYHTILGVALAHAALWRLYGETEHRSSALELTRRFLRDRGRPRVRPRQLARVRTRAVWNSREAIEAGSTLVWLLLVLRPSLSEKEVAQFQDTILRAHSSLRAAGEFRRYINGNYAIPLCELVYFSSGLGATMSGGGDPYEHCWRLLVQPASIDERWKGYGWRTSGAPGDEDWLDEQGYFTETPGYQGRLPRDTFDPQYAQLQLERLARLWLLNGDPRALRHLRAIHRLLLTHLDSANWRIGSGEGSRTSGRTAFFNPASCLLALHSPDSEVTTDFAVAQFQNGILADYRRNGGEPEPYHLRGYGTILMPLLLLSAPETADWRAPVCALDMHRQLAA